MADFAHLKIFVAAATDGSFSEAARQLGITPSSVSRQIAALEEELGQRLFRRTTRQQSLTEAGEVYLGYAERVLAEIEEGSAAVAQLAQHPSGTLRVTLPVAFGEAYIVPLLPRFLDLYPDVEVDLELEDDLLDLTRDRLDLAIRMGPIEDSDFVARPLAKSRFVVCCSPAYADRFGLPARPEDLTKHQCLLFRATSAKPTWAFLCDGGEIGVRIRGRFTSNTGNSLVTAACADLGIARLPVWLIHDSLEDGSLQTILRDFTVLPLETQIHGLFPRDRKLAPKVRAFIDFISDELAAGEFEPTSDER